MSTVSDQIEMRHAKRQTVLNKPAPQYCKSDKKSVDAAKKEIAGEFDEFASECFLIDRDVPVLILALKKAARRANALVRELRRVVTHHNIADQVAELPPAGEGPTWDEVLTEAWEEMPLSEADRLALEERGLRDKKEAEKGLERGEVPGQLSLLKDLSGKTIADIPADEQAQGGEVVTRKLGEHEGLIEQVYDYNMLIEYDNPAKFEIKGATRFGMQIVFPEGKQMEEDVVVNVGVAAHCGLLQPSTAIQWLQSTTFTGAPQKGKKGKEPIERSLGYDVPHGDYTVLVQLGTHPCTDEVQLKSYRSFYFEPVAEELAEAAEAFVNEAVGEDPLACAPVDAGLNTSASVEAAEDATVTHSFATTENAGAHAGEYGPEVLTDLPFSDAPIPSDAVYEACGENDGATPPFLEPIGGAASDHMAASLEERKALEAAAKMNKRAAKIAADKKKREAAAK